MHAYNKPEAEAPNENAPITTTPTVEQPDPHGVVAFTNLCELVKRQQSDLEFCLRSMTSIAKEQHLLKENLLELTTRVSELTGVITSNAMSVALRGGAQ